MTIWSNTTDRSSEAGRRKTQEVTAWGQLDEKAALITGGSSGIGRASALAFAREGATVVVADVDTAGGAETVRLVESAGGSALFVKTDVSRASEVEALVQASVAAYGRLDYAHNNAGIEGMVLTPTADWTEEAWHRIISINLKGVWLGMKYQIPQMLKQGGGAIVNTASIAGLVGSRSGRYGASKHGIVGLTKTAALEYAKSGIRVNAVCPGVIRTPMVQRSLDRMPELEERFVAVEPIGRIGRPEEVAEAAVWLCSAAASFVTGHAMTVDGGYVAQ